MSARCSVTGPTLQIHRSPPAGTPGIADLGLPTRAEIAERYASRTGASLADIAWYEAFALWKTGVVVQQLHHRWVNGDSTDPRMQFVADRIVTLVAGARHLLSR